MKQSDLNDADPFCCLHYVSKGPESEEHGVGAVQITSDDKCSVIGHRCGYGPRDHSQKKRENINHQGDEIQNIPSKYSLKASLQVPPSTMNNLVFRPRSKHHESVSEMVPKGRIMIGSWRQLLYCLGDRSVISFKRSSANSVNFDTNQRVIPTLFKEGKNDSHPDT